CEASLSTSAPSIGQSWVSSGGSGSTRFLTKASSQRTGQNPVSKFLTAPSSSSGSQNSGENSEIQKMLKGNDIVYSQDGKGVHAAVVEKLVFLLTHEDPTFTQQLLLTYRAFCTPTHMLQ